LRTGCREPPGHRPILAEVEVHNRDIKLGETISSLIERGGYSRNRQPILDAVGISAAALSQYARDQNRPSFQKLVLLADFFGVSLDFLVYGEPIGAVVDHGPLARYVYQALADAHARASRHSALVGRIGRVLADRVDDVARELADSPMTVREGLIHDDEAQRLEAYCLHTDILAVSLAQDLITMPGGEPAPGRFLEVVATNLARGRTYRFLLAGTEADHNTTVRQFRSLLASHLDGDHLQRYCQFRRTGQPVVAGAGIYRLDVTSLRFEEVALYEHVRDYLDDEGRIGYLVRPNNESTSDMLMSGEHTAMTSLAFDALWSTAVRL
jgi:transcriptional regulator with XRE-family HTH domain